MIVEFLPEDAVPPAPRERTRRAPAYRRHTRFNARGDAWCNRCQRYLPVYEFKRHPSRPGTLWSYCKPCVLVIDRERYRKSTSTLAGAIAVLSKRYERKKRHQREVREERIAFIENAITVLRKRGFTLSHIARLTGIKVTNFYQWQKRASRPSRNAERRFGLALQATAHIPIGETPAYRLRLPHPELHTLCEQLAPELTKYPMRSAWINGRRSKTK